MTTRSKYLISNHVLFIESIQYSVASPNSRHLLRLYYIRGLSYSEIAKRSKQKRITVYRRIVRTVSRLNIKTDQE